MNSVIIIMFIVIIVIGVGLMLLIALTRKAPRGLNQEEFRSKWLSIESMLNGDEGSQQLAILNADKLLDRALKARGYKGETMADRLKAARANLSNNNAVWVAHKLRNQIAHEDVSVKPQTAKHALGAFKKALKDLGAL